MINEIKTVKNDIKTALEERKKVITRAEMTYTGNLERPNKITVTVTADDKDTVYEFDNNSSGSFGDEKETNPDRLAETFGAISYIKNENDIQGVLDEGKEVTISTEMTYIDDSERPDTITVTVTADGIDAMYEFYNNVVGSLENKVREGHLETVRYRLADTLGKISCIKKVISRHKSAIVEDTKVYITYKGEDGNYYRTSVVEPAFYPLNLNNRP